MYIAGKIKKRDKVYHQHLKLTLHEACHVAEKSEWEHSPVNDMLWVWILIAWVNIKSFRSNARLLLASLAIRLVTRLPNIFFFVLFCFFFQNRFHSPFSTVVLTSRAHLTWAKIRCFVVYLWPLNFNNSQVELLLAGLNSEERHLIVGYVWC